MPDSSNQRWIDFDPKEQELVEQLGLSTPLGNLCPPPETLRALQEDVLPEEMRDQVRSHLETCAWCRLLARDLPKVITPMNAAEEERIRLRIFGEAKLTKPRTAQWLWWLMVPAGVVAGAILIVFLYSGHRSRGVDTAASPSAPAIPAAAALAMDKPAVIIPVPLLTRGGQSVSGYGKALSQALQPYLAGNYPEAIQQLESLEKKYPRKPEIPFYIGISELFLGDSASASSSLEQAKRLAQPPLAQECDWYLAVALSRLNRTAEATAALEEACSSPGEYQARSCAALRELLSRGP